MHIWGERTEIIKVAWRERSRYQRSSKEEKIKDIWVKKRRKNQRVWWNVFICNLV